MFKIPRVVWPRQDDSYLGGVVPMCWMCDWVLEAVELTRADVRGIGFSDV